MASTTPEDPCRAAYPLLGPVESRLPPAATLRPTDPFHTGAHAPHMLVERSLWAPSPSPFALNATEDRPQKGAAHLIL
jgi:hypothetical protein